MAVSELEMTSKMILDCVIRDLNYGKKNLKVFLGDHFNNKDCSSRSSVCKTEESLQINVPNPIDPNLSNPDPFNNPGQPKNLSRNEIMGASSLVQYWEARSMQQPSSSQNQSLIENRTNSEFINSENPILCSESVTESVTDSFTESEKEQEGFRVIDIIKKLNNNLETKTEEHTSTDAEARWYLPQVACTPMWFKNSKEATDFYKKLLSDRRNYLNWFASQSFVSKFSPRGFRFLQSMLKIRSLERCLAVQNGYKDKSIAFDVKRSGVMHLRSRYEKVFAGMVNSVLVAGTASSSVCSGVKKMCRIEDKTTEKSILQDTRDLSEIQEANCEAKIEKKSVLSEDLENKNCLKKVNPWTYKEKVMEKAKEEKETVKKEVEIVERMKEMEMEIAEMKKEIALKEEVRSFVEAKSMEIEDRISLEESSTEKRSSEDNDETSSSRETEELCRNQESETYVNDEQDEEEEEVEYEYSVDNDWVYEISKPRKYWKDLRSERYLEFMSKECSEKEAVIELNDSKQVSEFLNSDLREIIDKVLISHPQRKINLVEQEKEEEDNEVACLASNEERVEENEVEQETEKIDVEIVTESDDFSQFSSRSWSFKDPGIADTAASTSASSSEICDLKKQIEELRREMIELKSTIKSCVDFQESFFGSVSDSRKRKCCVCIKLPVDSLLYRCGHMCTCLKCGHELQWSSGKCPICLASIVDVVRVFLDF